MVQLKKIMKHKNNLLLLGGILLVLIIAGWLFFVHKKNMNNPGYMSLTYASKIGEKKTMQILIQPIDGNSGHLQRGDVVLVAPADKQFSLAEKEGFFIARVNITDAESSLLTYSKGINENDKKTGANGVQPQRRFSVDLSKIGVSAEEKKGRVVGDKVFEDTIFVEKK